MKHISILLNSIILCSLFLSCTKEENKEYFDTTRSYIVSSFDCKNLDSLYKYRYAFRDSYYYLPNTVDISIKAPYKNYDINITEIPNKIEVSPFRILDEQITINVDTLYHYICRKFAYNNGRSLNFDTTRFVLHKYKDNLIVFRLRFNRIDFFVKTNENIHKRDTVLIGHVKVDSIINREIKTSSLNTGLYNNLSMSTIIISDTVIYLKYEDIVNSDTIGEHFYYEYGRVLYKYQYWYNTKYYRFRQYNPSGNHYFPFAIGYISNKIYYVINHSAHTTYKLWSSPIGPIYNELFNNLYITKMQVRNYAVGSMLFSINRRLYKLEFDNEKAISIDSLFFMFKN